MPLQLITPLLGFVHGSHQGLVRTEQTCYHHLSGAMNISVVV